MRFFSLFICTRFARKTTAGNRSTNEKIIHRTTTDQAVRVRRRIFDCLFSLKANDLRSISAQFGDPDDGEKDSISFLVRKTNNAIDVSIVFSCGLRVTRNGRSSYIRTYRRDIFVRHLEVLGCPKTDRANFFRVNVNRRAF